MEKFQNNANGKFAVRFLISFVYCIKQKSRESPSHVISSFAFIDIHLSNQCE